MNLPNAVGLISLWQAYRLAVGGGPLQRDEPQELPDRRRQLWQDGHDLRSELREGHLPAAEVDASGGDDVAVVDQGGVGDDGLTVARN